MLSQLQTLAHNRDLEGSRAALTLLYDYLRQFEATRYSEIEGDLEDYSDAIESGNFETAVAAVLHAQRVVAAGK